MSLSLFACIGSQDSGGLTDTGDAIEYTDADGDGILDFHEGGEDDDFDGDGVANYLDLDSDADGINDRVEAGDLDPETFPIDSDGDGDLDFLDLDSDNNCINDQSERPSGGAIADTDGDGNPDFRDLDNDGDDVLDIYEIGSSCGSPDSDGDGNPDFMDTDSDNDGIGDIFEGGIGDEPIDSDGDGTPDYLDGDSDNDGISDTIEGGTVDPTVEPNDTDGDGTPDFIDTDSDGDGLSDKNEVEGYGTDPYDADTDGDGFTDGAEVVAETDPLDGGSIIDGIYVVVPERSLVEEKFEFELRIQEGDIAFLIDTTCSMSSTAHAIAAEFNDIVSELTNVLPAAKFGAGTYDDYAYGGYGSSSYGDKPFEMRQQITEDYQAMQNTLDSIPIHGGSDGPESSMEALVQAATGTGYDQDCDGAYDSTTDVKPFIADKSDPFGGNGGQFYNPIDDTTGELGGFGFNEYALPIIVYATDNYLRDPEAGYGTPGGCPDDAGYSDVVAAVGDLGAYIIGVNTTSSPIGLPQMEELAYGTGSLADTNGDGIANEPLAFQWTGSDAEFRETIVEAIDSLLNSIRFDKVSLEIEGDEWGFVTGYEPEYYDDFEPEDNGEIIDFTLFFRGMVAATAEDQLYELELIVLGDDEIALDKLSIFVVIPGTSY